jgi:endonuclease-3
MFILKINLIKNIKLSSISLREMKASTSRAAKNRKHVAVSYEDDKNEEEEVTTKKKSKIAPKDWEIIFKNIKQMRLEHTSPVDTMGCEQCADKKASPANQRFQILVALMLSAQTRDEVTFSACQRLK